MDVILVDENDVEIGVMEKIEAHTTGVLHRAFSVFIFNEMGQMLIHKRAAQKYHNPGLWTNACCSHPMPGEKTMDAAYRRLNEEMGFVTKINYAFSFCYRAEFDNGLIENEFDHVFIGRFSGAIHPNPEEVQAYTFEHMTAISEQLLVDPDSYTIWFRIAFPMIEEYNLNHKME